MYLILIALAALSEYLEGSDEEKDKLICIVFHGYYIVSTFHSAQKRKENFSKNCIT